MSRPETTRRVRRATALAALALLAGATSCRSGKHAKLDLASIREPDLSANAAYLRGRTRWFEARAQGDMATGVSDALYHIRSARITDTAIPIYPSREGWLLVWEVEQEVDPANDHDRLRSADQAFAAATTLSEDWVPGHLGRTRVALLRAERGDTGPEEDRELLAEAAEHVAAADAAYRRIARGSHPDPTFLRGLLIGLFSWDIGAHARQDDDPYDAKPSEASALDLFGGYLEEDMRGWDLARDTADQEARNLVRGLNGWIDYYDARVDAGLAADENGAWDRHIRMGYVDGLRAALQKMQHSLEIELVLVDQLLELGEIDEALTRLDKYIAKEDRFPLIARDRALLDLSVALTVEFHARRSRRDAPVPFVRLDQGLGYSFRAYQVDDRAMPPLAALHRAELCVRWLEAVLAGQAAPSEKVLQGVLDALAQAKMRLDDATGLDPERVQWIRDQRVALNKAFQR